MKSVHRNAPVDFKQMPKTWNDDNDLELKLKRAYSPWLGVEKTICP
jgi:hypothetical protein